MKNIYLLKLVFIVIIMVSCNSSEPDSRNNTYVANAEDFLAWVENEKIKEVNLKNHPFAFFVDSVHEFSYGLKIKVSNIKVKDFKKIIISCDGYLYQTPSNVQLVIDIKNDENTIFWYGKRFDKTITEASQWGNVSFTVNKPIELKSSSKIFVYTWSPGREPALMDNLKVKFE